MNTSILIVKAGLAVMFLMAGAAKLAYLKDFVGTVRLFAPGSIRRRKHLLSAFAVGFALCEVGIGTLSFSFPSFARLDDAVFGATCVLVVASVIGFVFHRGAACRCFGRLSQRSFDKSGIAKSVALAVFAGMVTASTPSTETVTVTTPDHLLLIGSATLVAVAVGTAVRELASSSEVLR